MLLSIDSLYKLAFWNWKLKIHSAQTLFIAPGLFLLLQGFTGLFLVLGLLRLALYLLRKSRFKATGRIPVFSMILRITALMAAMLLSYFTGHYEISIFCFALGEVLDRTEFYNELNVPSPRPGTSLSRPGTSPTGPGTSPSPG